MHCAPCVCLGVCVCVCYVNAAAGYVFGQVLCASLDEQLHALRRGTVVSVRKTTRIFFLFFFYECAVELITRNRPHPQQLI